MIRLSRVKSMAMTVQKKKRKIYIYSIYVILQHFPLKEQGVKISHKFKMQHR